MNINQEFNETTNSPHLSPALSAPSEGAEREGMRGHEFDREEKFRRNGDLKHRPAELQGEMARRLAARECTQAELADWLAQEHQIQTNQSGISRWYKWYRRPERPWNHGAAVEEAVRRMVAMNPHLTEDERFERGQTALAERAIEDRDVDAWCKTQRLMIARRNLKVREAKLRMVEEDRAAKVTAVEEKAVRQKGMTEESKAQFERDYRLMPSDWVEEEPGPLRRATRMGGDGTAPGAQREEATTRAVNHEPNETHGTGNF